MSAESLALRERRRNGLPRAAGPERPLPQRILRSPWTWVALAATLVYIGCLWWTYATVTADIPVKDGVVPGLNWSAIRDSARLAAPTLAFWVVVFIVVDRFRPQRLLMWYLALGWGAAVSTSISMVINTWAAQEMAITGNGDPSQGARAAIFVAPFVEEATKATILFWIALAVRYRLVSKISGIALAGLSAAGFAFTENIIYYARVIVYSSTEIGTGDPDAALRQIVFLRGLVTMFGHPLFTVMTGIGLMIGLRARSKVVRILAPIAGYLVAALLHMIFNTTASIMPRETQLVLYFTIALPLVLGVVIFAIVQLLRQSKRIKARLTDYVRSGWLPEADTWVFSRLRARGKAIFTAATWGWSTFVATIRLQRALTELAYLRDSEVRGLVDEAAYERARELLDRVRALRPQAIDDPRVQKPQLPKLPRRRPGVTAAAEMPLRVTASAGAPPLGSTEYSPVDPRWGPPKG